MVPCDFVALLAPFLKDLAGSGRLHRVLKSHEQLIINVETPLVQICGTNIDDAINDDQLGVQNLGLIFKNPEACAEHPAIKTLRRKPGKRHIRLPTQHHLNRASAMHHLRQIPPKPARGQKVGRHDLHVHRMGQILPQRALDRVHDPAGTTQEQLGSIAEHHFTRSEVPQGEDSPVQEFGPGKHFFE